MLDNNPGCCDDTIVLDLPSMLDVGVMSVLWQKDVAGAGDVDSAAELQLLHPLSCRAELHLNS